ncbi:MAG: TonB-dependent receptor, partial [Pseudomonadota bacterium]
MNDMFSNAGVRATGLGAAVLALGLVLNPGHPAAQQGVRTEINLPAQSLRQSLVELGNQTGVNVISADALVAGRAAPEVSGSLTPEAAVQQLLSGSGLSYRFTNARTVVIQQVAQADGGGTGIVGDEELVGEDIIVEGEKVLRTLDETPSSVAVISGEAAASPANRTAQDAIQSVPNVLAPESSNLPAVRGIDGSAGLTGGAALTTGAQPRIPIIVDGVARPIAIGATPSLASNWDLRAVEVARGPQGTTTGRNALAGAVRIWTNDPVYSFEGAVRANFFTEEATFGGAFMLNMPVVENQVALRVAGNGSFGSTFVNVIDPALNADQQDEVEEERFSSLRAKVLITPEAIPELELLLTYERTDSQRLFSPGIVDNTADNSLTGFSAFMSVDDNEQSVYAAELRYEASDNLSFEVRGSFLDNTFIIPNLTPIFDYEQSTQTIAAEALARFSDIGPLSKGVFGVSFENQIEEGVNDVPD